MFKKLEGNSIGALLFHQDQMKDIVNNLKEMKRAIKLQKDRPRHCCDIKEAQGKSRSPSVHSTSQPAAISDQNMVK